MIQFYRQTSGNIFNFFYINIYDKMVHIEPWSNANYHNALMTVVSQQTGKSKTFTCYTGYLASGLNYYYRYCMLFMLLLSDPDDEQLENGYVFLGSTDYPFGFYDVTIYENTSDTNLDPAGLTVVWSGLMNLSSDTPSTIPVDYKEYTTNDADTDSVYITL